jgi:hypothetical protein
MTAERCEAWRGLVGLEVVGQLDPDQRVALDAHVDQCPECRQERQSLLSLADALAGADPDHLQSAAMPMALEESVLGMLRSAEARRMAMARRRRNVLTLSAGAAAVLVALGLMLSVAGHSAGRTVALSGPGATRAIVSLTAESWGTSVQLSEARPSSTGVLALWMRTSSGTWWEAGTYRASTGRSVHVTMACAVQASAISQVWVRDAQGRDVMWAYVA